MLNPAQGISCFAKLTSLNKYFKSTWHTEIRAKPGIGNIRNPPAALLMIF